MLPEKLGKDYNIESIEAMKTKYNKNIFNDSSLKEVIEDFALTSLADLGKWSQINKYLTGKDKENNDNTINTKIDIDNDNENADNDNNNNNINDNKENIINLNEIRTEELIESNIFNINENDNSLVNNK